MPDQIPQEAHSLAQALRCFLQASMKLNERVARSVSKLDVLQLSPDVLVGVDFGGVGRKRLELHAADGVERKELSDRDAAMDGRAIPEQQERPVNAPQQVAHEPHDVLAAKRGALHGGVQPTLPRQGADRREVVSAEGPSQGRRSACRRPRLDGGRGHVKGRFVHEDGRSPFRVSFFLRRGQRSVIQARTVRSSRCDARTTGF